jgi:hypothetical protein
MKRALRLRRETLTDLTTSDLTGVVAGAEDYSKKIGLTCPAVDCARELTVLPQCNAWTFTGC